MAPDIAIEGETEFIAGLSFELKRMQLTIKLFFAITIYKASQAQQ